MDVGVLGEIPTKEAHCRRRIALNDRWKRKDNSRPSVDIKSIEMRRAASEYEIVKPDRVFAVRRNSEGYGGVDSEIAPTGCQQGSRRISHFQDTAQRGIDPVGPALDHYPFTSLGGEAKLVGVSFGNTATDRASHAHVLNQRFCRIGFSLNDMVIVGDKKQAAR